MKIPYYQASTPFFITQSMIESFNRDGALVIENAISQDECQQLMKRMAELVDAFDVSQHQSIFSGVTNQQKDDRYFLESGGEVRYFFEKDAFNADGELTVAKEKCLNKVGHALHDLDPVFSKFCRQKKFEQLVTALGMSEPLLLQSMYIFKQPKIGGEVLCHQDSPYLWTEPQSCIGLWFALEDATLDNGCLWGIPGQHKERIPRGRLTRVAEQRAEYQVLNDSPWPEQQKQALEVEAGTCVVLHGQFPHLSGPNTSAKSRHAFALHLIDGTCDYPATNWLQRDASFPLTGF